MSQFWNLWNSKVESRALERAARLGRKLMIPVDYEAAHLGLLLDTGYERVARWRLVGRPHKIPADWRRKNRTCRYCRLGEGSTTFRFRSHAVPEFLGNTALISADECDRCNRRFSQGFEGHFDKFTLPCRAFFGVRGKNRYPKYKPDPKNVDVCMQRVGDSLDVRGTWEDRVITYGEEGSFGLSLRCQPVVLLEVYRCLVKMALAMMPCEDLKLFDLARRWVVAESLIPNSIDRSWAWCHLGFTPDRDPEPLFCLWRRNFSPFPVPFYLAMVSFRCFVFMYAVPGGDPDSHLLKGQMWLPRFDFADCEGLEAGGWQACNLSNPRLDRNVVLDFQCDCDGFEDLQDGGL